tara:strand:+ start:140 stop:817 length:678 start_codon:yes stop_codon:yes gene_type:complete
MSLCFCVYVGAGSEGASLWINLFTSILGVIIGHEMTRILALHKFYSASVSREDINEIDLGASQSLLGNLRKVLLFIGMSNVFQVLLRLIVLGCKLFEIELTGTKGFLNITEFVNKEWPTLGEDVGLIDCGTDCSKIMKINGTDLAFVSCFAVSTDDNGNCICVDTKGNQLNNVFCGCNDLYCSFHSCNTSCKDAQNLFVTILATTGAFQISAFFLARLIRYGKTD